MSYLTKDGTYYEGDKAHVTDVACARRPEGHLFTGTISTDPSIMWRPRTAQEVAAELDARALELDRIKDALVACIEELFVFVKTPGTHNTVNSLKQAIIQRYRNKL